MDYKRAKYEAERDLEETERCVVQNTKILKHLLKVQDLIQSLPQEAKMEYGDLAKVQIEALIRVNRHIDFQYGYELQYLRDSFKRDYC